MDCKTCQDLLVDHVSGTLAPRLNAEIEAELRRCETCRGLHERLARGHQLAVQMPLVPVPDALSARIMAGAEAELARRVEASAVAQREHNANRFQRWLRALGQVAMGRQVAMATIMVLIAVGTSWIIPELTRAPNEADVAIVSTEESYPTLAAEPPRLPPRTQNSDQLGRGEVPTEGEAAQGASAPAPAAEVVAPAAGRATAERSARREASLDSKAPLAVKPAKPAKPAKRAKAKKAATQEPSRPRPQARNRTPGGLGGFAPPPPARSVGAAQAAPTGRASSAGTKAGRSASGGGARPQSAPVAEADSAPLDGPVDDAAEEESPTEVAPDRQRSRARQALGRDCKDGLRQFDALAANGQLANDRALLEAAVRCLRRAGRASEADRYARRLAQPATE